MPGQFYTAPLQSIQADGPTIVSSAAEALIVPDQPIAGGYMYQGKTYRGTIVGRISNVVTATPTITFRVRLGTVSLTGTQAVTSGAITTRATAATTEVFRFEFTTVIRTTGSGGTAMTTGQLWLPNATGATTLNVAGIPVPQTAPATSAVDTTVANILGVSAQWSASNAANGITVHSYLLEEIN